MLQQFGMLDERWSSLSVTDSRHLLLQFTNAAAAETSFRRAVQVAAFNLHVEYWRGVRKEETVTHVGGAGIRLPLNYYS